MSAQDWCDWHENRARLAEERAERAERLLRLFATDRWLMALAISPGPRCLFWGCLFGALAGFALGELLP